MDIEQLRRERAEAVARAKEIMERADAESRSMNDEETANFDKAVKAAEDARSQIERIERLGALEVEQNESRGRRTVIDGTRSIGADINDALRGFLLREPTDAQLAAMEAVGIRGNTFTFAFRSDPLRSLGEYERWQTRAQSTVTDNKGGYLVPESFSGQVERAMLAFGGVRQAASVFRTTGGNPLPWPTVNDTSTSGRILAESGAVTTTDATFGSVSFGAYKFSSDVVLVPNELVADAGIALDELISSLLAERIARKQNAVFTLGTGENEPQGIVTGSTLGVTAASASAITFDELLSLYFSVDAAYRANATFMLNDTTLAAVAKIKDDEGNSVWLNGLANGMPATILGKPYIVNNDLDEIAASAKVLLFGDLSKYKIRDVRDVQIQVLRERYADNDQTAFIGFARADGKVLDAGTHPIKHLIMDDGV